MKLPIRTRLTIVYCVVFFVSTALLELGAYYFLDSALYAVVDQHLTVRLAGVEDYINRHVTRLSAVDFRRHLEEHAALHPKFLEIRDDRGATLYPVGVVELFADARPLGPEIALWTTEDEGQRIRVLATRRLIQGDYYSMFLGSDLTMPYSILSNFRTLMYISAPIVLACASLAGYWIAGRSLKPVLQMTNAAEHIGATNLSQRLVVPQDGDELQHLAETLNGMLCRIEDSFRRVAQFTADASHELRTPLALIRASSEVALLGDPRTESSHGNALRRILHEAEKASVLLDSLLKLARADSGTEAVRQRQVDLNQSVRHACDQLAFLAKEKGVDLQYDIRATRLFLMGDSAHLERLWLILLDNAIKYTPSGGSVKVAVIGAARSSAIVEVRDTGAGIAEADLPHVFERFFRGDKARQRETGAGLGLSLAKWIVDVHRASVEVTSAPGVGSTFRVVFPKQDITALDEPTIASERRAQSVRDTHRTRS